MSGTLQPVQPEGWAAPRGYANGVVGEGRVLFIAGQIGWHPATCAFESDDFVVQFDRALANVLDVLRAANAGPEHVARMTVYVTEIDAYRTRTKEIGAAWRARFGKHFPAMALVGVAALVEPRAKVEIEATAVLPALERA